MQGQLLPIRNYLCKTHAATLGGSSNMHVSTAWVSTSSLLFILTPSPLLKSEGQISLPQHCPASFLVDTDWCSDQKKKKKVWALHMNLKCRYLT